MDKKVLIIVVSYNGAKWIGRCLDSALRYGDGADIILIDNASTDDTISIVPQGINVVRSADNLGFGAANNMGFEYALAHGYDYVYLLNQDAYLTEGALAKMVSAHAANPSYGILSPVQMNDNGAVDLQFRKRTSIDGPEASDSPVEVDFVMAAHWLIPASALKRVGAFSPTFLHYGEDDNIVDRMKFHGYKVGVLKSAYAIHDRSQRQSTKAQRCTRKCLIPVIRMSNPSAKGWSFLHAALWLCGCSVKNLSLIPVKSIPALWKRREEIKANRAITRGEGAFL